MKTEAIKLVKGPYNLHYAKNPKSKIFLPVELDDNMYNKIGQITSKNAAYDLSAQYLNKPMIFYPKDPKTTLMNFGPITTILKNDASVSDIAAKMYEHTQKVISLNK